MTQIYYTKLFKNFKLLFNKNFYLVLGTDTKVLFSVKNKRERERVPLSVAILFFFIVKIRRLVEIQP